MRDKSADTRGSGFFTRPEDGTALAPAQVLALRERLLGWYRRDKRDLPWRRTRDPYAIWVSEVMLQQTRVETVIPYYARFLERFPTVRRLAEAPEGDVLAMWSGLGYYRRARLLHRGAKAVGDALPETRALLLDVPGIGPYTAGAVASIAFGESVGLVDGNVARVLARILALKDDMRKPAGIKRVQVIADALVDPKDPGAFNQSLMELGATICIPKTPRCEACPVQKECRGKALGIERELPVMSAKKAPIAKKWLALVATQGESVLLARRTPDRVFGSLWEPPTLEGGTKKELLAPFTLGPAKRAGSIEHVLTHRHLTVDVLRAELRGPVPKRPPEGYDAIQMAVLGADLGISTFARKILAAGGIPWHRSQS